MAKSIYLDKKIQPDEISLNDDLGEAKLFWDEIISRIQEIYSLVSCEWKHYGVAWGWSYVIKSKAKTLCYLIPQKDYFYDAVIFNDKGRAAATDFELPEPVKQAVEATKNNPKNIPYDFNVSQKTDVEIAMKLIEIRSRT